MRWSNQPGVAAAASTMNVAKGFSSSCSAGWVTFDSLGSMVQYWRANNNNYGIEIRSPNETNNDWWKKWRPLGSGNAPYLEVYYTEPDTTGPGKPTISSSTHSPSSTWFSNASPSFNWTTPSDPSGIEGYSVKLDQSSNTMPDNSIDVYGNSTSYGAQTSGEWWFHVRAKDGAGNWSPDWDDYKIRIDTLAPQWGSPAVSSSTHPSETSWSQSNDPCFSWSASDPYSLVAGYSYELTTNSGATPDTNIETTGTSACFSDYGDGTWYFRIRAKDNAGNWSTTASYTVKIDYNPATPSISSTSHASPDTWYANQNPSFNWSASDESGISGYSYELTTSSTTTPDAFSEGSGTATSYSGLADGEWWMHVRAQNGAGGWGTAARRRVRIDTSPAPSPSLSSSTHPSQSAWSNNNDPSFSFSTSDMSGISGYSFTLDQSSSTIPDGTIDSTSGSKSYTDIGDGTWYFHVRAQNGSGLWSGVVHYQVNIDTVVPGTPSVSSSTHPAEGVTYANNDPSLSWDAIDDRSGVGDYSYVLDQLSTTTPDTTSEGSGTSKSYADLADGTWWFHVRARDNAGNWGPAQHFSVTLDTPAPDLSVAIAGPTGQTDSESVPIVKDGDQLVISGLITEGVGGNPDSIATITGCDVVILDEGASVELNRLPVSLSNCRNIGGTIVGSVTVGSFSVQGGYVVIEAIAGRTVGGVTKSSVPVRSEPIEIDNSVPSVTEAVLKCGVSIDMSCDTSTRARIDFSEPVSGGFGPEDFQVTAPNQVLTVTSDCTLETYCDRAEIVTALPLTGTVSYQYVTSATKTRPKDGAGHYLATGSLSVQKANGSSPCPPDIAEPVHPDDAELNLDMPCVSAIGGNDPRPAGIVVLTINTADGIEPGTRSAKIARRINKLRSKSATAGRKDGITRPPDVIILQEADPDDRVAVKRALNAEFGSVLYRTATGDAAAIDPGPSSSCVDDSMSTEAILYRAREQGGGKVDVNGLVVEGTGSVVTGVNLNCEGAAVETYVDESGQTQLCPKYDRKKHWLATFRVPQTGYQFSVASVHFLPTSCLNAEWSDTRHDQEVMGWSQTVASSLDAFGAREEATGALLMGGDFSIRRCKDPLPEDEGKTCQKRTEDGNKAWWSTMQNDGWSDVIRDRWGDNLRHQYLDGNAGQTNNANWRPKRIDYLWTKSASITRASHDLSCGVTEQDFNHNCKDQPVARERYADHRLLWTIVMS